MSAPSISGILYSPCAPAPISNQRRGSITLPRLPNRLYPLHARVVRIRDFPLVDHNPSSESAVAQHLERRRNIDMPITRAEMFRSSAIAQRTIAVGEMHISNVFHPDPFQHFMWLPPRSVHQ